MKQVNFIEAESLPMLSRKVNEFLQKGNKQLLDVKAVPNGSSYFATLIFTEKNAPNESV